jgi:hypothetical protein
MVVVVLALERRPMPLFTLPMSTMPLNRLYAGVPAFGLAMVPK